MAADIVFINRWRPPDPGGKRKSPAANQAFPENGRTSGSREITVRPRSIQGLSGFAVEALDPQLGCIQLAFHRRRDTAELVAAERARALLLVVQP